MDVLSEYSSLPGDHLQRGTSSPTYLSSQVKDSLERNDPEQKSDVDMTSPYDPLSHIPLSPITESRSSIRRGIAEMKTRGGTAIEGVPSDTQTLNG